MSSLQKEPKIYGAVESQSYITFTGFCKKIYDTTQQSVDVFIDDVKIDTILANQKIRDIENKYEVFDTNGFCFTYELPKECIGKKHKLEFKTQNGEQLLHSPTHTLDKFSPLYNQAMFIENLAQPLQYHAVENGYTKNALSFIAIEENLGDEAFIEFVLEMCKKHKELSLSIFYFNEHQKNEANKVLNQVKNKTFFNPTCAEELIKNSEIYLHNTIEEFRFTINEEYYNKVKNIQAIKENLFIVELTRKAKKKKEMAEMAVDTITPINFETSVMAEMFKEDEKYSEFVFMNSLGQVDEAKIKDMYCPNSIGFLATEENLKDEAFMGYIKELMRRFPTMTIKGFCFRNNFTSENIEIKVAKNIYDVLGQIEFFIPVINDYPKFNGLFSVFKKCSNITQLFFNQKLFYLNQTIDEYDTQKDIFNFRQNKYLEEKEISLFDKNIAKMFLSKLLSFAEQSSNLIKENDSISEWIYFNTIKYSVGSSKAKAFLNNK